jgi:antitoxin CcdA
MKSLYDLQAPKKPIDLALDLSSTIGNTPKQALVEQHERQWKIENRTVVKAYNDFVEDNGCFSDDYRSF